jgi:hypothetical protein
MAPKKVVIFTVTGTFGLAQGTLDTMLAKISALLSDSFATMYDSVQKAIKRRTRKTSKYMSRL